MMADDSMSMAPPVPVHGLEGCNEWASYHWHSFGCHAHPDDPHPPADEPAMADDSMMMADDSMMMATETMSMAPSAPVHGLEDCNEWAGYHWHSFGCHAHPDDPHPTAAERAMADDSMMMAEAMPMMATETMSMAPPAPTAGATECNAWAGYHRHSFGCHAHPDTPHASAE